MGASLSEKRVQEAKIPRPIGSAGDLRNAESGKNGPGHRVDARGKEASKISGVARKAAKTGGFSP
jgi:hypothetical protein